MEYAWRWFEYHANQRLTMIRFFLTIAAAIAAGTGYLWAKEMFFLSMWLGVFGFIASFAFMRLDSRVSDLVELGENALKLQQKLLAEKYGDAFNICEKAEWRNIPGHSAYHKPYGFRFPYSFSENLLILYTISMAAFFAMAFASFWYEVTYLGMH